jgi:hypothetical protein
MFPREKTWYNCKKGQDQNNEKKRVCTAISTTTSKEKGQREISVKDKNHSGRDEEN